MNRASQVARVASTLLTGAKASRICWFEAGVESAREQRDDRCAPQREQHVAHGV